MSRTAIAEKERIAHSKPSIGAAEARAAAETVASGVLRGGGNVGAFERAVARAAGTAGAVAVSSGSAAIHLALKAMGIGAGRKVAIPSYACVSILQAVKRAGAEPLIVDCTPAGFHMDPADLARRGGNSAAAIVYVHTFGLPGDVRPFLEAGVPVIEDIATALGASIRGRSAGAAGRAAICSFNATKMITTGGGGAIASSDPGLIERAADRIDYDAREDAEVRYNEAMGEIGAAVGLVQIARLGAFVRRRTEIAAIYMEELSGANAKLPEIEKECEPAWHRFVIRVADGAGPVRKALSARGIDSPPPVRRPLHGILRLSGFPEAEAADREALSLPIYPDLSDVEARRVAREVRTCLTAR